MLLSLLLNNNYALHQIKKFLRREHTLQTVNHGTEGNHQVTTRVVTCWLPRKVGEMVFPFNLTVDNKGGYLVVT